MKVPYNYLPMEFRKSNKILSHWKKLIQSSDFTLGKYVVEFEKKFSKHRKQVQTPKPLTKNFERSGL